MAEGVGQDISEWVHAGQSHAARRLSNFELESSWEKFSNFITGKKIASFQHFFFYFRVRFFMHTLAPGNQAALAACRIPNEHQHTGLSRIKTWSRDDGIVYGEAEKQEFVRRICTPFK